MAGILGDELRIWPAEQGYESLGLMDQHEFRERLTRRMRRNEIARLDDQLAVVFFNVENFKHYNQSYGYAEGDKFLRHMAQSIKNAFEGCEVVHIMVDQFVVLTSVCRVEGGVRTVRADFRREHKDTSIWLRAGYYVLSKHDSDAGEACDKAKTACDELRGRRDAFLREYDDELQHQIVWRRYVLEHFNEALEKGWIRAFCQPIVRVATGETCDVEVLARWIDPGEGIMPPSEFIPVLEEARLVHLLDLAVLRDACRACHELESQGIPYISLSFNMSRLDFELCDMVSEVEAILEEYDIPRHRVAVEITESALTGNQEFLREEVDRFRSHGFEVWMDDFGSGYSSLNVLKDYTFDLVKIDMAFLYGLEDSDKARIMLAKTIDMLKELGVKTLVEGVETQGQYEYLRALGCGRAQGYLFGRPEPLPASVEGHRNETHPSVELQAKHDFYEEIGRINLMRPDPHPDVNGQYMPSDVAACIILRRCGEYEYLSANELYTEFVAESRVEFDDRLTRAIDRCVESGEWEHYAVRVDGTRYPARAKLISSAPEFDAVGILVIVDDYHRLR